MVFDAPRRQLCVANLKGMPAAVKPYANSQGPSVGKSGFNSRRTQGTLSLVPLPTAKDLPRLCETVWNNFHRRMGSTSRRCRRAPASQPRRARADRRTKPDQARRLRHQGESHLRPGARRLAATATRGCASSASESRRISTSSSSEFVLLDNTYCAGILSADGHQWSTTAFSTDYMENFRRLPPQLSGRHGRG